MAARMAYFHQQNKFGAGAAAKGSHNNNTMEVSPELHIKMSKKIAQLTKVIYALNTKNDEHDASLQSLRETHEEETQKLLGETEKKMAGLHSRLDQEQDLWRRIKELTSALAAHEERKQSAVTEFGNFKEEAERREGSLKAEHSKRVLSLSKDLLDVKRNFEVKLSQFEKTKEGLREEQDRRAKKLEVQHKRELEILRKDQTEKQSGLSEEVDRAKERLEQEIVKLRSQNDALDGQREEVVHDYEAKLEKLQAFHERELAVLRDIESEKQSESWSERERALREEFQGKENKFKKRADDLNAHLAVLEDELSLYKERIKNAEDRLNSQASRHAADEEKIRAVQEESARTTIKLKEVGGELAAARMRSEVQARELLKKAGQMGSLEATKLSNEATILDQQSALAKLGDKLSWLEAERRSQENSQESASQEQRKQLKSLEKALEDLSIEKQVMKERFERELATLKTSGEERESKLAESHRTELTEQRERLERGKKEEVDKLDLEIKRLREEFSKTLGETTSQLSQERDSAKAGTDRLQRDLTAKLKRAEDDARKLSNILQERDQGLGSANSHIEGLKKNNSQLKTEVDVMQEELREASSQLHSLESSLERSKHSHITELAAIKEDDKRKLDNLAKDLDVKWTDTLRIECNKLREELMEQHQADKRAALEQTTVMKNREMEEARGGWEQKLRELLKEISTLKESLSSKSDVAKTELSRLQRMTDQEVNKLKFDMAAAAENHRREMGVLRQDRESEGERIKLEYEDRLRQLELELTTVHNKEMSNKVEEHRKAIQALQLEAEESRKEDLDVRNMEHKRSLDKLRLELMQRHGAEMDQLRQAQKTQMAAARMELERAIELRQQQEKANQCRMDELQSHVNQRDRHIDKLEENVQHLKKNVSRTKEEIEFKAQEIMRVQSDAQNEMREVEENLIKSREKALDAQSAQHLRETQGMLGEFNRAQDLLKDKLSALQIMLEEAEDRYRNRGSRDEDLETIANLKDIIDEKDEILFKLNEEKRFFQLELINRETNFNKVFNTQPNVGVLNPFTKPKRRGPTETSRFVSAPNLHTPPMRGSASSGSGGSPSNPRLDPLPASPVHDIQLNPNRPLREKHGAKKVSKAKRFINT